MNRYLNCIPSQNTQGYCRDHIHRYSALCIQDPLTVKNIQQLTRLVLLEPLPKLSSMSLDQDQRNLNCFLFVGAPIAGTNYLWQH